MTMMSTPVGIQLGKNRNDLSRRAFTLNAGIALRRPPGQRRGV